MILRQRFHGKKFQDNFIQDNPLSWGSLGTEDLKMGRIRPAEHVDLKSSEGACIKRNRSSLLNFWGVKEHT